MQSWLLYGQLLVAQLQWFADTLSSWTMLWRNSSEHWGESLLATASVLMTERPDGQRGQYPSNHCLPFQMSPISSPSVWMLEMNSKDVEMFHLSWQITKSTSSRKDEIADVNVRQCDSSERNLLYFLISMATTVSFQWQIQFHSACHLSFHDGEFTSPLLICILKKLKIENK